MSFLYAADLIGEPRNEVGECLFLPLLELEQHYHCGLWIYISKEVELKLLCESTESSFRGVYHSCVRPLNVVGNIRHIRASEVAICSTRSILSLKVSSDRRQMFVGINSSLMF